MDLAELAVEEFECPRCRRTVSERLYGPCVGCRAELSAMFLPTTGEIAEPTGYVPKMNVVPNQVATKD